MLVRLVLWASDDPSEENKIEIENNYPALPRIGEKIEFIGKWYTVIMIYHYEGSKPPMLYAVPSKKE